MYLKQLKPLVPLSLHWAEHQQGGQIRSNGRCLTWMDLNELEGGIALAECSKVSEHLPCRELAAARGTRPDQRGQI